MQRRPDLEPTKLVTRAGDTKNTSLL
ncbi:protein of unknown function [Methylocella tundrae]|uniref:Uncharacterized protein n=1 Tax=Methylocella tundrae TaxID=227605 RepID=A0A4U8Z3Y2_METTU|nr:protein of unknown function [Methylocella tundrae]